MAGVMIGIDPHKGSHTALRDRRTREAARASLRVRASAAAGPSNCWTGPDGGSSGRGPLRAREGLGNLLAQQLIAAGEHVLDVPPKLAARVRLLDSGQINKTDQNDARSVAVAALRAHALPRPVGGRRHRRAAGLVTALPRPGPAAHPGRSAGCTRCSVSWCPAEFAQAITDQPSDHRSSRRIRPNDSPMTQAKLELARDLVADLQHLDAQRREDSNAASPARWPTAPTSITDIYGVGPIVAACVLGYVRDIRRFPSRDRFASYNGTAPIEVSSGDRKILPAVPAREPPTQPRHPRRSGQPDPATTAKAAPTTNANAPKACPANARCARSNARSATRSTNACSTRDSHRSEDPGGQSGNDTASSVAGSHPETPALRTSHSRATTNPKTNTAKAQLRPQPTPDRRALQNSGAAALDNKEVLVIGQPSLLVLARRRAQIGRSARVPDVAMRTRPWGF